MVNRPLTIRVAWCAVQASGMAPRALSGSTTMATRSGPAAGDLSLAEIRNSPPSFRAPSAISAARSTSGWSATTRLRAGRAIPSRKRRSACRRRSMDGLARSARIFRRTAGSTRWRASWRRWSRCRPSTSGRIACRVSGPIASCTNGCSAHARPWLPGAFCAAAALPHLHPDKRKALLQSIGESAATAPGWSAREPSFYPEWVDKIDETRPAN